MMLNSTILIISTCAVLTFIVISILCAKKSYSLNKNKFKSRKGRSNHESSILAGVGVDCGGGHGFGDGGHCGDGGGDCGGGHCGGGCDG